jgi:hypothetical protein
VHAGGQRLRPEVAENEALSDEAFAEVVQLVGTGSMGSESGEVVSE